MRNWLYLLTAALALCIMLPLPAAAEDTVCELLTEANTGCVLYEEHADMPVQPGSLSKLMTAYLTAQAMQRGELAPDTALTAGESVRGMRGAVVWLEPGDRMTVDELLLSLLAGNANDAAAVLADAVSGDAAHFVMDMNAAAFDLGMRDTRFTSPQGFDDPASYTTAHDLGLLVVDEEQRFGVRHKERIKQLRTNVDVLTLSATPIPRTLHMSLSGIKDMSTIEEPPEDRYPVQTYSRGRLVCDDGRFVGENGWGKFIKRSLK